MTLSKERIACPKCGHETTDLGESVVECPECKWCGYVLEGPTQKDDQTPEVEKSDEQAAADAFTRKDGLAYMTSVQGYPAEVWWKNETHGYEEKSHYWLRVPHALCHSDEDVWMEYSEGIGGLVRPTRPLWGLKVEQDNKLTWESWKHNNSVGGMTRIEITLHGKVVWETGSYNNLFRAVAYAQSIILRLQDLPVDLNEHDRDIKDRRIWYYDQPAIIEEYQMPEDRLVIRYDDPDPTKGFNMRSASEVAGHNEIPNTWQGSPVVHDSIFSGRIRWFRDAGDVCPPGKVGPQ